MTIKPVVMNGVIQRVQDMESIKQQEDLKPEIDQQNIQNTVVKEEKRLATQVIEAEQKELENFRYDAKEKGGDEYRGNDRKKKRKKQKTVEDAGRVIRKDDKGFDIKI